MQAKIDNRNQFVDIMRGIAMLLVVLGHTMTGCTVDSQKSFLFNIIWSLQMPLFILISGFVTKYSRPISDGMGLWKYVKRRTVAYMLPWAVWSFLVRGIIFGEDGFLNVKHMGSVPYTQVQKRMAESDITVIVEGFEEKDINLSRYSLSTKAADALASGASILTYGSLESGIIEYMQSTNAAMVCTDKAKLVDSITQLISNQEIQKKYYEQAIVMTREHHNLQASCKTSEDVVAKAIRHMK